MLAEKLTAQLLPKERSPWIMSRGYDGRLKALESKFKLYVPETNFPDLPTRESLKDFLTFQRYFFKLRTGIDFRISQPISRRSHHLVLAELAPQIFNQELNRLMVNIAPRYGKSEWAIAMIAYGLAFYPNSRYMYISKDSDLAIKHCKYVRQIINLPEFQRIFKQKVTYSKSTGGSFTFTIEGGGEVYAVGSGGGIAGRGAGMQAITEFGGFCLIDDFHKIDEVTSDTVRNHAADTYVNSIVGRLNNPAKTPIIFIGQICHEDDLPSRLKAGKHDFYPWHIVELKSLDSGTALYPEMHTVEMLLKMKDEEPYMFSAQHQQKAAPAGGSLFLEDRFVLHGQEIYKKIFYTFVTIDSADTEKSYNDATAMTFFGIYEIEDDNEQGIGEYGIHILDCINERVTPDKLEALFDDFWLKCRMFHVQPGLVGIEKKVSGVTLLAMLNKKQGLQVVNTIPYRRSANEDDVANNTKREKSKINRFINCQKYVNQRYISLTEGMKYTKMVLEQMTSITANDTHKFDDIADTIADAIYMTYISKFVLDLIKNAKPANDAAALQYAPVRTGNIEW